MTNDERHTVQDCNKAMEECITKFIEIVDKHESLCSCGYALAMVGQLAKRLAHRKTAKTVG
jgi:hypothetical protein